MKHRDELERLIDEVTQTKTTREWLEVLEESGMPYSAINDVKTTLELEHGESANNPLHSPPTSPMN